jgi:hypothetical protein
MGDGERLKLLLEHSVNKYVTIRDYFQKLADEGRLYIISKHGYYDIVQIFPEGKCQPYMFSCVCINTCNKTYNIIPNGNTIISIDKSKFRFKEYHSENVLERCRSNPFLDPVFVWISVEGKPYKLSLAIDIFNID